MPPVPYGIASHGFWRAYWVTLRPYLFFVSGVSGAVGLALAPGLGWRRGGAAMTAFFLSYGLGQALTDVFQIDTDAISSPYRPLTQGLITRGQVLLVSLSGLLACAVIFLWLNPWTLVPSALGVVGLATYTPFKRRWWGGPFWNSWIVALLPAIGVLCGRGSLMSGALGAAAASIFSSYAIFVLLGYFKDISADRATGYDTFPVRFGWRAAVLLSTALVVATVAASTSFFALSGWWQRGLSLAGALAPALSVSGLLLLAAAHTAMLRTRDERAAHGPIALVVRGYVLLHAGEAVAVRPALLAPALLFYGLFEVALAVRPERTQI